MGAELRRRRRDTCRLDRHYPQTMTPNPDEMAPTVGYEQCLKRWSDRTGMAYRSDAGRCEHRRGGTYRDEHDQSDYVDQRRQVEMSRRSPGQWRSGSADPGGSGQCHERQHHPQREQHRPGRYLHQVNTGHVGAVDDIVVRSNRLQLSLRYGKSLPPPLCCAVDFEAVGGTRDDFQCASPVGRHRF